jgi:flagellar P-ring protein precursor FlgI
MQRRPLLLLLVLMVVLDGIAGQAAAATRLKNICRVKGQEENTLQGLGLVVGLKGTGDGGKFLPTIRSLATAMELMGSPIGAGGAAELRDAGNVAIVAVTARIPAAGGRQGDTIDCQISSIGSAKSLAGGRLIMAPLQGPQVTSSRVFAFAEGPVHLDDPRIPTTGRVHKGCRLEEDFFNAFTKNNKITLVLNQQYADFEVAQEIAELINSSLSVQSTESSPARAINPQNIEVNIPQQYREEPVQFVAQVTGLSIAEPRTDARVVINERAGSIIIGADVEIGAVVVTHKNIVIETGDNLPADRFIGMDTGGQQTAKLKSLVEALNAVKVPTEDVIEIIKGLERNGKLHGRLVIE